jgi:hypothetical protein
MLLVTSPGGADFNLRHPFFGCKSKREPYRARKGFGVQRGGEYTGYHHPSSGVLVIFARYLFHDLFDLGFDAFLWSCIVFWR